ncbi:MAG: hypothetical protein ACEQSF_04500 [Solirubrobacteraceae bacterium]
MKIFFISLSVLCLISFTSCKKSLNTAETEGVESSNTSDSLVEKTSETVAGSSNLLGDLAEKGLAAVGAGGLTELVSAIPQLKDATATKTLTEYAGLVGKLIAASKIGSSDTASIQESAATKFKEVAKVIQTLSPEEKTKAMEWLTKLTDLVNK